MSLSGELGGARRIHLEQSGLTMMVTLFGSHEALVYHCDGLLGKTIVSSALKLMSL